MSKRWLMVTAAVAIGPAFFFTPARSRPNGQSASCAGGRFVVQSGLLVDPSVQFEAVVFEERRVSIGIACPPVAARLKETKRGMRITAAWRACEGVKGKSRLKAILALGCATMEGTFLAPRARIKRLFAARLSSCGDGVIDSPGGETCDQDDGCGPGFHCTETCSCVRDLAATTTTSLTTPPTTGDGGTTSSTMSPTTSTTLPTVSFSAQVQPIFTAKCATVGCHGGSRPEQGLHLGAGQAYGEIVNVGSTQCAASKLVLPGAPSTSYLMWKIQGSGPCFLGQRMPSSRPPLSAADIATISNWVAEGAPSN